MLFKYREDCKTLGETVLDKTRASFLSETFLIPINIQRVTLQVRAETRVGKGKGKVVPVLN
jgi:hypothetical protein